MRWTDAPSLPTPHLPELPPLVAQILARRGISSPHAARAFLDPSRYNPTPATALPGLSAAVERLSSALRRSERICVWGDFDVDGQTATAVLVETLRTLNADVTYHIPIRSQEGHGLNLPGLQAEIEAGARLLLTCDTGIRDHEAVDYARARGVDVIITDHHDLPPHLPAAHAVVNPKLLPADHPLATLAGVGAAFKLAEALLNDHPCDLHPTALLDLVALGLVADLALLTGETRYLVQTGLAALRATSRLGLQATFELAELDPAAMNEAHISFVLAPRLNSLGRLGDANPAVEFLTTRDPVRARVLAAQLENYNAQRQLLTDQVTQAAEAQLRANPSLLAAPVIIVGHPSWPGGVVGIVAARLVERYGKPAIVLTMPPGEPVSGSARSVEGLHITEAIAAQADLLLRFGGHPMAAGLSLLPENLPAFSRRLAATVEKMMGAPQEPTLEIEAWLPFSGLTEDLAAALESLAPFGPGNPRPVFASRNLHLENAISLGRNKEHRKLILADEQGIQREVLWWDGGAEDLPSGTFDLAYTVRAANWRGKPEVQLEFVALQSAETETVEVKPRPFEVVDYRAAPDPLALLERLKAEDSTLVWIEGEEKEHLGGVGRRSLERARHLVIWSIPPSPEELRSAIETVRPQVISLIAAHPPEQSAEEFITRLAGLLKFVIRRRAGQTSWEELAAATGQRVRTVQRGLMWLVKKGKILLEREENGQLWLSEGGPNEENAADAQRVWREVQGLLQETNAYRAYFRRAEKDSLFA
jgi:single-stranded-DNA-specific exonuclease